MTGRAPAEKADLQEQRVQVQRRSALPRSRMYPQRQGPGVVPF